MCVHAALQYALRNCPFSRGNWWQFSVKRFPWHSVWQNRLLSETLITLTSPTLSDDEVKKRAQCLMCVFVLLNFVWLWVKAYTVLVERTHCTEHWTLQISQKNQLTLIQVSLLGYSSSYPAYSRIIASFSSWLMLFQVVIMLGAVYSQSSVFLHICVRLYLICPCRSFTLFKRAGWARAYGRELALSHSSSCKRQIREGQIGWKKLNVPHLFDLHFKCLAIR